MTGPDHYKTAEIILEATAGSNINAIASAQVHATLALAAAMAMGCDDMHHADFMAWDEACGVKP